MRKDGIATREKILDAAQVLILERGYAGMTVDLVLAKVGITKGAFFHHFKTKDDLARALLERFADYDAEVYRDTRARAEKLSDDPLQQVLIFIRLFEQMFSGLVTPYPGCLFASYLYELQQFGDDTRSMICDSFASWRQLLREKFEAVVRQVPAPQSGQYGPPSRRVYGRAGRRVHHQQGDERAAGSRAEQLRLYRNYIELLFDAPAAMRGASS